MTAERPRDRLGRPLPSGGDPATAVPPVLPGDAASDDAAWRSAMGYLSNGLPFHAHEVFELRWRLAEGSQRDAWRALAQWGAALTHEARGNGVGAQRLAGRALATLDGAVSLPPCIDEGLVRRSCLRLAE
ncbi:MAG: DUF309 domain-containing protein [Actinomycetota bacterium]|nr:DUF309 domain-containing protein [Actinomycetota bacterium]